jgi:hypothetical protein
MEKDSGSVPGKSLNVLNYKGFIIADVVLFINLIYVQPFFEQISSRLIKKN